MIGVVVDYVNPPGALPTASPRPFADRLRVGGLYPADAHRDGWDRASPLTGIPPEDVPTGATQAVQPEPLQGGITGVVWRDFKPGGGTIGKVEPQELGLPGVTLELLDSDGEKAGSTTSADDGSFAFENLDPARIARRSARRRSRKPFEGMAWLGPSLITPAAMIAYIWVWAGFSMVVIAAGLAAIPRDTLEAARTDGATEWQVFRRVTVPLLAPVLSVVFITMLINVLKVFDIILSVAPGSVQDDANVIALAMWRTSFGGVNDFGLGSAIAVFLFVLVIPILALNVRRFRRRSRPWPSQRRNFANVPCQSRRAWPGRSDGAAPEGRCTSALLFIGLMWLLPTFALFLTSLMTPAGLQLVRLVEAPRRAEPRHLGELQHPLERQRHPRRARDDAPDHDRRDDPADHHRGTRGVRVRSGSSSQGATGSSSW